MFLQSGSCIQPPVVRAWSTVGIEIRSIMTEINHFEFFKKGGGRLTACAINTLPQLGVHFSLQYDIPKSEPSDEGHLPEEDFFSASLFFYTSFLGRRLV